MTRNNERRFPLNTNASISLDDMTQFSFFYLIRFHLLLFKTYSWSVHVYDRQQLSLFFFAIATRNTFRVWCHDIKAPNLEDVTEFMYQEGDFHCKISS